MKHNKILKIKIDNNKWEFKDDSTKIFQNLSTYIEKNSFSGNNCYAFNMPAERSINIDTLDDLTLAKKYINDN